MHFFTQAAAVSSEIKQQVNETNYEETLNERVRERILELVTWTKAELSWHKDSSCAQGLKGSLSRRIKQAATGCFVTNWNFNEEEDVCDIFSSLDLEKHEGRLNGWCDNEENLLRKLLGESGTGFSWHRLIHFVTIIRLCRLQISELDDSLSQLTQLKALIFSSNLLKGFNGSLLPRDLRFLELYNNNIDSIAMLAEQSPEKLLYMGLGRNRLKNNESLEGLSKLKNLCFLDLSDNDLSAECVSPLKTLPCLKTLCLFATPYSMAISYKRNVIKEIPQLIVLDEADLRMCSDEFFLSNDASRNRKRGNEDKFKKRHDKRKHSADYDEMFDLTGELLVYCYRVYGVPQPKGPKNIKHLYYMELECPLLDEMQKKFFANQIRNEDEELKLALEMRDDRLMSSYTKNKTVIIKESDVGGGKYGRKGDKNERPSKAGQRRSTEMKKKTNSANGRTRGRSASQGPCGRTTENKLFPLSTICNERHKLSTAEQWKSPIKKCFQFKSTQMTWKSADGKKMGKLGDDDEGVSDKRSRQATVVGSEADKTEYEKKTCPESAGLGNQDPGGKEAKHKGSNVDSLTEMGKSKKPAKKAAPKKSSKKLEIVGGAMEEGANKKNPIDAKMKLKMMQEQFQTLLDRDVESEGRSKFRTKELEWAKVLEFKQPISVKTKNLMALRDTFRTVVKLRLIHITKDKTKKSVKPKGGREDALKDPDVDALSREKLAVIPVPLEAIKWNEQYIGYIWDFGNPCMADKFPNVKDLKYSKGGLQGKKETEDWTKMSSRVDVTQEPQTLTAHLGVGVKRDTYD